jgi:transcription termination/antitermination protein NusA
VPEVASGTVLIKSIAREPGFRTKVAVESKEEGVDPIGAMVGQRGTRIMAVINELGGEKIDVIPWDAKPEKFIANALAPAKIVEVKIEEKNTAIVFVPSDQLSLAIGKDGRNVRLAANLTGWKIDIKTADVTSEELEGEPASAESSGEVKEIKKPKKVRKSKKAKVENEEVGTDGEPEEEEKIDETTADEEPEPIPLGRSQTGEAAQEEDDDDAAKDDK